MSVSITVVIILNECLPLQKFGDNHVINNVKNTITEFAGRLDFRTPRQARKIIQFLIISWTHNKTTRASTNVVDTVNLGSFSFRHWRGGSLK
mmetsp:Transcript_52333/g.58507  ORF Transcript_52333/g.58507 Transcript_52333/m.58507 type:complete len:92 (+) Transcript_52333:124-399(+)